jgi:hypothetical protein
MLREWRGDVVSNAVGYSFTYTLNRESLHSIILLNFPCNIFCSVGTGVKVDGNIATIRCELQADEFTCQYLRVSNAYE